MKLATFDDNKKKKEKRNIDNNLIFDLDTSTVIMRFDDKYCGPRGGGSADEKLFGLLRGRAKSRGDKVTRPCFPVIAHSGSERASRV